MQITRSRSATQKGPATPGAHTAWHTHDAEYGA